MENYNDGNWHKYEGFDICPVHGESIVDVMHIATGYPIETKNTHAGEQFWENVVAFRVVKERKEPREYTIDPTGKVIWFDHLDNMIHVREVLDND